MATVKLKFRPSDVVGRPGVLYYQVIHKRIVRQILTPYHIFPEEWNFLTSEVLPPVEGWRREEVDIILEETAKGMSHLNDIIKSLDSSESPYTSDDIVERYFHSQAGKGFFRFMEEVMIRLKDSGKVQTARNYRAAYNSFKKFMASAPRFASMITDDLDLSDITPLLMAGYQGWLKEKRVSLNTISFYNRILRAVYNLATNSSPVNGVSPFKRVYTGRQKTRKRAIDLPVLKEIKTLKLSPGLDFCRDIFMMSFYLRGISFVDLAWLQKSDLHNGYISYVRKKTGQKLLIQWKTEMQAIVDKYCDPGSPYLLPILSSRGDDKWREYHNAMCRINTNLKKIGEMLQLKHPLTLYVARHSWASTAYSIGIPVSVISEGLGHDSEATTRIYLSSLQTDVIDNANDLVIDSL